MGVPRPHSRRRRALLLGALLLAGLILVVGHVGELERFARLAGQARPAWLLLALLCQALTYVCAAGVWYLTLRWLGLRLPFAPLVPLGLAKLFSDQALPSGGVSGTAFFVAALRRQGVPPQACLGALLVSLVAYRAAFLAGALTLLALLWWYHELRPWITLMLSVFVAATAVILAASLWLGRRPPQRLLRRLPRLGALAEELERAPRDLLRQPVLLVGTALLHAAVFLLDAATLWAVLRAIGQEVGPAVAYTGFMLATVAASIGLIPLGLGSFEATCVAMLGLQGVGLEAALAGTLLLRGLTLWLPMLPGLYLVRRALD